MVIDCFMFLNELDILEIRLNSLAPYVDRFILCESPLTFSGKPKPLYFQANQSRFSSFPITHLIMPTPGIPPSDLPAFLERSQRDFLMTALEDVPPETLLLCSDVDEIPNLKHYDWISEGVFRQREYCYFVNVFSGKRRVKGTVAVRRKNLTSFGELRLQQKTLPIVLWNGGWHFTFMGGADAVVYQMDSGCHCLVGAENHRQQIEENRGNLRSPFYGVWGFGKHRMRRFAVENPSGPDWLLQNRHLYPRLWYSP